MMTKPLLLYSTNSYLAYSINEQYYGGLHYAWCSPYFHKDAVLPLQAQMVPSSTPAAIYLEFTQGIKAGDLHCQKVKLNRDGLKTGAKASLKSHRISPAQFKDIIWTIENAQLADFRPVVYVIPFNKEVMKLIHTLHVSAKAHPFSPEYLIKELPRKLFDVIEWT